jgi:hypothetical protein
MIQITPQMRIPGRDCGRGWPQGDRLAGPVVPGETAGGSLLGLRVYLSQPAGDLDSHSHLRRSRFWLAQKRLSKGRFVWWPSSQEPTRTLQAHQAQLLLAAGNPQTTAAPVWRGVGG